MLNDGKPHDARAIERGNHAARVAFHPDLLHRVVAPSAGKLVLQEDAEGNHVGYERIARNEPIRELNVV